MKQPKKQKAIDKATENIAEKLKFQKNTPPTKNHRGKDVYILGHSFRPF